MKIVGIIIILLGLSGIPKYLRQRKYGVFTEAVVSKIEKGSTKYKASTYYHDIVYMTFHTENGEQATSKTDEKENVFHIGDTVRILYLSNNPKKIYLEPKKTSILTVVFTSLIGVVLTVVGIIYFP